MGATGPTWLFTCKLKLIEIKYNITISSLVILTPHPALSSQMGLVATRAFQWSEKVLVDSADLDRARTVEFRTSERGLDSTE